MKATTSGKLPCCCNTETLFDQLRASREGWERSQLLLRLIDELNACQLIADDPFHPWRRPTRKERALRTGEAVKQQELARLGLRSVLVDGAMSFDLRMAVLQYLVDRHARSARAETLSHEQAGVRSDDLETLGARVVMLRTSVPPPSQRATPSQRVPSDIAARESASPGLDVADCASRAPVAQAA